MASFCPPRRGRRPHEPGLVPVDLLTHGLVGALAARSLARHQHARLALGTGFVAALLPDADTLIRSPADPLLAIEFHRHFSHSLLFAPLGALLAAGLLWLLLRRREPLARLYWYALAAYVSACLLDTATSYGTQLFWPLSATRHAWNLVAIVDPLLTLAMLAAVMGSWRGARAWLARGALLLGAAYLALGYVQRERAVVLASELAAGRGHAPALIEAKPTIGNLLVWRTLYLEEGLFYVDAVRPGLGASRVYPGESIARFQAEGSMGPDIDPASVLAGDIRRFSVLSAGYVALHPGDPLVLGDVRYAVRPNGVAPLWGIEIDLAEPDRHARFVTFRSVDEEVRSAFLAMLRGEPSS